MFIILCQALCRKFLYFFNSSTDMPNNDAASDIDLVDDKANFNTASLQTLCKDFHIGKLYNFLLIYLAADSNFIAITSSNVKEDIRDKNTSSIFFSFFQFVYRRIIV